MDTPIEQMNEAIALFMGLENDRQEWRLPHRPVVFLREGYWIPVRKLQYHSSWDWLMPVVIKIKELIRDADYDKRVQMSQRLKPIQNETINVNIGATHYCVYQFIQWYQTNKQKDNE